LEQIKTLEGLAGFPSGAFIPTVAVAAGQDEDTILAVHRAVSKKFVKAVLVGDEEVIKRIVHERELDPDDLPIEHCKTPAEAATKAVSLVRSGEADILMKGLVRSDDYLKAILNKNTGLLDKGELLSHMAVVGIPQYPRLLLITDAAIIPLPSLEQKLKMISYAVQVAAAMGVENPKVALVSASEAVSPKVASSVETAVLATMGHRKQIPHAIVDGPLALDVALSPEHCTKKGLESEICGDADVLLFPNIESANTFYKCCTIFAGAKMAGVVMGTRSPVVLTSRADTEDSKFYSIALAARMAIKQREA